MAFKGSSQRANDDGRTVMGSLILRVRIAFMDEIPRSAEAAIAKKALFERIRRALPADLNSNTLKTYFHQLSSDRAFGVRVTADGRLFLEAVKGAVDGATRRRESSGEAFRGRNPSAATTVDHQAPTAPSWARRQLAPPPEVSEATVLMRRRPAPAESTESSKAGHPPHGKNQTARTHRSWALHVGDADVGKVFDHLERYGSLSEDELVKTLGSARRARSFSTRLDEYLERLPFEVEVVVSGNGKLYRKR